MTREQAWARIARLEAMALGLSQEVEVIRKGNDPLLYLERKAYMAAIQDAIAGAESARVVLCRARQRERGGV